MDKYFAYGSNMDPKRVQDRKIKYSVRKHAVLKGYNLRFNKIAAKNLKEGFANIVRDEKGIVEGVYYEISDSGLSKLDEYEKGYDRIPVKVQLDDGQDVDVDTYIAKPNKQRDGLLPSKEYLNHLLAAKDVLSSIYYKRLEAQKTLN